MLHLVDPRRFAIVSVIADYKESKEIPDSLNGLQASKIFKSATRRHLPIKVFLMDQKSMLGIGNIYSCEILHRIGISPLKKTYKLGLDDWRMLCRATVSILRKAASNRGTTVSDWADLHGNPGAYQKYLRVYGREGEPCCRCGASIVRTVLSGRGTYYCSSCQPA
jgi:formamidopyrimidine-DNA glycosylase